MERGILLTLPGFLKNGYSVTFIRDSEHRSLAPMDVVSPLYCPEQAFALSTFVLTQSNILIIEFNLAVSHWFFCPLRLVYLSANDISTSFSVTPAPLGSIVRRVLSYGRLAALVPVVTVENMFTGSGDPLPSLAMRPYAHVYRSDDHVSNCYNLLNSSQNVGWSVVEIAHTPSFAIPDPVWDEKNEAWSSFSTCNFKPSILLTVRIYYYLGCTQDMRYERTGLLINRLNMYKFVCDFLVGEGFVIRPARIDYDVVKAYPSKSKTVEHAHLTFSTMLADIDGIDSGIHFNAKAT